MARIAAFAASSHHSAGRSPPHPHRSGSASSVVRIAARMYRDAAAAGRATGLHSAVGYFREQSTLHALPRIQWLGDGLSRRAAGCRRRAGGDARLGVEQVWEEEDLDQKEDPSLLALEAEIYEFMLKSSKPTHFPTTDELIAAGRMDIVTAIAEHGGWLTYGCGFDDDEDAGTGDVYGGDEVLGGDGKERGDKLQGREWTSDAVSPIPLETGSETVAMEDDGIAVGWLDNVVLQQQREVVVGEDSGIEGILNRLEKERSSSYGEVDSRISSNTRDDDSRFADSGTIPYGNKHGAENFLSGTHMDDLRKQVTSDLRSGNTKPRPSNANDKRKIQSHLQLLESDLDSVLRSLRSRTDAVVTQKGQEGSIQDVDKFCDALEFQETEIMNAQDKLRGLRAKLVAFEGKITLDILEAQKILEEKQRRLNAAQQAMSLLHTVYVVWPYTASTVFLAGSFNGWTSQMQMEKTSTCIFSLYLKLYPGEYEIKFIVDGVWKVDPLRPTVTNNGHENNLLIVQ